jgi:hypothetical protein
MGTLSVYGRAVVDRVLSDHCWKICPMVFRRPGIAQRWRHRIHNHLLLFRGEIASHWTILTPAEGDGASLVPVVHPESAKPTASGAIKLKLVPCNCNWPRVFRCYLSSLEVWPARQARNAASACSRSSALLSRRRGCLFAGVVAMGVPPLTSSTPCRCIRRRCFIRDQFVRPLMCNHHSKAAGKMEQTGGFALAPQRCARRIVGAVEPEENRARSRSDPIIIHPCLAKELGQCLLLAQSGHAAHAGECLLLGVKRTSVARSPNVCF